MVRLLSNKYFYFVLLAFFGGFFCYQNNKVVEVDFLAWNLIKLNLLALLGGVFLIGLSVGLLICLSFFSKKQEATEPKKSSAATHSNNSTN